MKKASVFLVALVLIVASAPLFADGAAAKWTNWGEGIVYPYFATGTAAANNGWGPNWDGAAQPGADQEWTWAYDGNNYGYAMTTEFGGGHAFAPAISWWQAYYKFFDMLKVTFGQPNMRDYRLTSKIEGFGYNAIFNWGDQTGLAVQLTPVAGLSLAAALYVPMVDVTKNTAALDFVNAFGVAGSYAIPDMATIAFDYRADKKQLSVGANVTAVKDIGIVIEYQADFSNSAQLVNSAFASVSAAFAPVNVAVDAGIKSGATLAYSAELDLQYAMGMWVLGATAGYDTGTGINGSGTGVPGSGVTVYPYVKANFDNGSNVKIGFIYASGSGTSPVAQMGLPILYTIAF